MDWTTAGAGSGFAERGVPDNGHVSGESLFPILAPDTRRIMSSFTGDPQDGWHPEREGPLLVMPPPQKQKRSSLWLKRLWLVVFVLFCLEVGIVLTVLPWTRIWTENSLLLGHRQVQEFLQRNFVRGLVSGLGLIDIWMGIAEAIRYREDPEV
jgi:hypothetical protein